MSLFDTSEFLTRRQCGDWPWSLIWTHSMADLATWIAYVTLSACCIIVASRRSEYRERRLIAALFAVFIFACGQTHAMDALTFVWPIYRFEALVKMLTAIVSLVTAGIFSYLMPRVLRRPTALDITAAQGSLLTTYEAFTERFLERTEKIDKETAQYLGDARKACGNLRKLIQEVDRG